MLIVPCLRIVLQRMEFSTDVCYILSKAFYIIALCITVCLAFMYALSWFHWPYCLNFNRKKYLLSESDDKVDFYCLVKIFVIPAYNIWILKSCVTNSRSLYFSSLFEHFKLLMLLLLEAVLLKQSGYCLLVNLMLKTTRMRKEILLLTYCKL
jgi:hypothetical protein